MMDDVPLLSARPLAAWVVFSIGAADGNVSALPLNSAAPAFTLADAKGQPWHLADHLGRERILVVPRPGARYLDDVTQQAGLLRDRDLRVVALLSPGDPALKRPQTAALTLLSDPGGRVAARYGQSVLIGKDRGVKALYPAPPSLSAVLELVDAMPMRQQERQQRGR